MTIPRIVIVGTGPAGVRAAQAVVAAGLRPVVVDEGRRDGGQIYRRQPEGFQRPYAKLYGSEAAKAQALHQDFDALRPQVDYRSETLAWNLTAVADQPALHVVHRGEPQLLPYDALLVCSGATDRLMPVEGWHRAGCYSLGAAQIALKAQACAIGGRVVFLGSGPLLYLVASQYEQAGAHVEAVLDTAAAMKPLAAVHGGQRLHRRCGVQHRFHMGAGLLVLRGHQVQQRPAAQEHHAPADGAGLGLERDLRRAQAVAAGAVPAFHRHQPVGGTAAHQQCVIRQQLRLAPVHHMQGRLIGHRCQVPGQGLAAVVHLGAQRIEVLVQGLGLGRFAAVQLGIGPLEAFGLAAVDLAAVAPAFVDDDGPQACGHHGLRGAHAGRPRSHDDDARDGHSCTSTS